MRVKTNDIETNQIKLILVKVVGVPRLSFLSTNPWLPSLLGGQEHSTKRQSN